MKFLTKEWSQQMSKKGFLLSSPQVPPPPRRQPFLSRFIRHFIKRRSRSTWI